MVCGICEWPSQVQEQLCGAELWTGIDSCQNWTDLLMLSLYQRIKGLVIGLETLHICSHKDYQKEEEAKKENEPEKPQRNLGLIHRQDTMLTHCHSLRGSPFKLSTRVTASSPLPGHCFLTHIWISPGRMVRNCSSMRISRICSLV